MTTVHCQVSKIEQRVSDVPYNVQNSIIKNFNEGYNVVMSYGPYPESICMEEMWPNKNSAFFIQNISSGSMTYIVSLPCQYEVRDIQFVRLKKIGVQEEDGKFSFRRGNLP